MKSKLAFLLCQKIRYAKYCHSCLYVADFIYVGTNRNWYKNSKCNDERIRDDRSWPNEIFS